MSKQSSFKASMIIDVDANLNSITQQLSNLKGNLKGLNLTDGMTKGIHTTISKLESEMKNFQVLSGKDIFGTADTKELEKSFQKIQTYMRELEVHGSVLEGVDLTKLMPKEAVSIFKDWSTYTKQIADKTKEVEKAEEKYQKKVADRTSLQKQIDVSGKIQEEATQKINQLTEKQNKLLEDKKKIESDIANNKERKDKKSEELKNINDIIKKYKEYQSLLKKGDNLTFDEKKRRTDLQKKVGDEATAKAYKSGSLTKRVKALDSEIKGIPEVTPEDKAKLQEVEQALQKVDTLIKEQKSLQTKARGQKSTATFKLAELEGSGDIEKLEQQFKNLDSELKSLQSNNASLEDFRKKISELTGVNIEQIPKTFEELNSYVSQIKTNTLEEVKTKLEDVQNSAQGCKEPIEKMNDGMKKTGDAAKNLSEAEKEVEALQNRLKQFFSLTNAVNLFKRAVNSAISTVKELDETMTEAAVVTNFTVSDMWNQLPTYSKNAKALGISINDLYGATTLYYQQGMSKFDFLNF